MRSRRGSIGGGGVLVVLAASIAAGCAGDAGGGDSTGGPIDGIADRKVKVVTTTNFVTDLVSEVGGDRVEVDGLMGAGVDPHLYKASAGDVQRITDADVVFYVGLHLEARMGDVLEKTADRRPVVAVGEVIDEADLLDPPSDLAAAGAEYDPHVWFDTDMWAQTPDAVADALADIDPSHADEYRERASAYAERIREAGEVAQARLAKIPEERRVLVTSHDAFRYFGRRFDVDVEAIQGISTVSEATTDDIERIATMLADRGIPAVFVESSVPRQTIEAVIAAAEQQGAEVEVGGELFSDAAGDEGTPEGTYLGMLEHNVDALVEGLS
jgi:manganese/zinc/iron transport system substrate-binding protein